MRFRPRTLSKRYVMQKRRKGKYDLHNIVWTTGYNPYERGPLNRRVAVRIFKYMHHLIEHAPDPVRMRHIGMEKFWDRKFDRFGGNHGNGTSRVLERSISSWL